MKNDKGKIFFDKCFEVENIFVDLCNQKENKMNKSIYKYQLEVTDTQKIELPVGAEILTVQTQNETPYLWALVDPNGIEKETIIIEVFGTGHPISYDIGVSRKYISTFQLIGGQLEFHVFEYTGV